MSYRSGQQHFVHKVCELLGDNCAEMRAKVSALWPQYFSPELVAALIKRDQAGGDPQKIQEARAFAAKLRFDPDWIMRQQIRLTLDKESDSGKKS